MRVSEDGVESNEVGINGVSDENLCGYEGGDSGSERGVRGGGGEVMEECGDGDPAGCLGFFSVSRC